MDKYVISIIYQSIIEGNSDKKDDLISKMIIENNKSRNYYKILLRKRKYTPVKKAKGFVKTIEKFSQETFKSHFRMEKNTFEMMEQKIKPFWKQKKTGRRKIKLRIALYFTIWRLSTGCSFREISNLFNIGRGAVYSAFVQIIKILYKLRKKFIKWPKTEEEQYKVIRGFESLRKHPFPYVIGCVDGCHIPIIAPKIDAISYYNRKKFHSVILQGVCDSSLKFTDIFFGYPGSCHDANVWENSPLGLELKTGKKQLHQQSFLLGDSAYPLRNYLIVPYRDNGHLTEAQSKFNYVLRSTRVVIEQAFGRLKSMFRILKYIDFKNMNIIKLIVISCIVLHNFIIESEGVGEVFEKSSNDDNNIEENNGYNLVDPNEAAAIRDRLAVLFCS